MGKKLKIESVFGSINYSIAFLLLLAFLFAAAFSYVNPLGSCKHRLTHWRNGMASIKSDDIAIKEVSEVTTEDPLQFQLRRLVRGDQDKIQLENSGFICQKQFSAESCVTDRPIIIDNQTINIPSSQPQLKKMIKPYVEKILQNAHDRVSPVQIIAGEDSNSPACHVTHYVPAVVFSGGRGFTGNIFHEVNEMIIPLFITTHHFRSQVKFVITDFNPKWVKKYTSVIKRLSGYELINPAENGTVHCFPGGVIGLKYHGFITTNSTDFPGEYSMTDFRKFLRESFNLKHENIFQIKRERPVLLLISRKNTRFFLNEYEMVATMEEVGFEVVVVRPNDMSNLDKFTKVVNMCSVMVGAHGAGLTNDIFLPSGAVMVQVVLLGLDWHSNSYFGAPATNMGLHYLEYKIEPEESTLFKKFGREHPVITNPDSIGTTKGYLASREVYFNLQNVRVNLTRFRETIVQAMELVDL